MSDLTVSNPVDTFMQAANQAAMRAATGIAAGSTLGDLIYFDGTSYVLRPATTDGFVLTLSSGIPVWAAAASGGVTSLGGASGVLTLGSGLSIPGNVLTLTLPALFATQSAATPAMGTFTDAHCNVSYPSTGVVIGPDVLLLRASAHVLKVDGDSIGGAVLITNDGDSSTPSGGAKFYTTAGEMFVKDASGVDVNLSTLQADTGFAGPASNGDKATSVTDYAGGGALFSLDAAADNQIKTLTSMVQALVASLRSDKIPRA